MATFEMQGLSDYMLALSKLEDAYETDAVCKSVLDAGASVLLDAVRSELNAVPSQNGVKRNEVRRGITDAERKDLSTSLGASPVRSRNGIYDVKIGFAGYGKKSKNYPNGLPNQLLARAVNSGTSFRAKTGFLDRAQKKAKKKVLSEMEAELEKQIKNRIKK